ncbi:MAG: undecaprenyl/decaprenyl-phosphate alpha-N-acetylglucosaminyl 1-phosphate transferase [Clostridia bacterium]|nr:undecaprenyl/decaprenyl-phosphate alpha-N-acetylglucosaminyl 1-phosphate transferase [Clostridia bacterium]
MNITILLISAFLVAFLASFASTPLAIKIAHKIGAVDVPKDKRRMHDHPIPRLGGIAIVFGFLVAVTCFCIVPKEFIGIILGALIIVGLGILDDRKPIPAVIKFLVQILAACIPVAFGVKIEIFTNPNLLSATEYWVLGGLSIPITILWIVGLTNAVNLIDGLDGLAAGVASISSVCLLAVALLVSEWNIAVFTARLAGACFGFLPYNFNPAKIFMGDSGSTFLGYMLACISIEGLFKGYAIISFAVPLLIVALPLFDTSTAILRRIKNKKPIMSPDRGHLHHKLIDMGFSQKQAVLILYGISALMGISAIIITGFGTLRALLLLSTVILFIGISMFFMKKNQNND